VKPHEHLNHVAGRAETSKNGQDLRSRKSRNFKIFIAMKKRIISLGIIAAFGFGTFLASCGKEEDNNTSCSCTESDYEGYSATRNVTPSSYGAASCADLELKLKKEGGGEYMYSCH
jgi:hypothetical protein